MKIKRICKTCGKKFYVKPYRKNIAKYCSNQCHGFDKNLIKSRRKHFKKHLLKYIKTHKSWNEGLTKNTNKILLKISTSRMGKNNPMFGKRSWCRGQTKYTNKILYNVSKKNKIIIQKMYDEGKIDLSKRKIDYKAISIKNSEIISRMLANGELKNQHRFVKGLFKKRNGKKEFYESSYELVRMRQLEKENKKWTKKHGIRIKYFDSQRKKNRYYIPDFLIGNKIIEEVKPAKRLDEVNNKEKFCALKKFCKQNNYRYRIITEKELGI